MRVGENAAVRRAEGEKGSGGNTAVAPRYYLAAPKRVRMKGGITALPGTPLADPSPAWARRPAIYSSGMLGVRSSQANRGRRINSASCVGARQAKA